MEGRALSEVTNSSPELADPGAEAQECRSVDSQDSQKLKKTRQLPLFSLFLQAPMDQASTMHVAHVYFQRFVLRLFSIEHLDDLTNVPRR